MRKILLCCIIIMGGRDKQKQVKIYYLDIEQQWQPYAVALLHLDIHHNAYALKIELSQPIEQHLITIIPVAPILEPLNIQLELSRVSKVERMDDKMIALQIEEWSRVLAFNFRDQDYCDLIVQQIEQKNTSYNLQLPCPQEQLVEYVAEQLEQNPLFTEFFFNSEDVIAAFVQQADKYKNEPDSLHKRTVFRALKLLLLRADRTTTKTLLKEEYFPQTLLCLSYNYQFGDRMIQYPQEFQKMTKCFNVLQLQDPEVLSTYHETTRIKFLLHVATSMFINPQAECLFQDLLQQNAIILLTYLADNPQHLSHACRLAKEDPVAFIQLFSQLWELFKSVTEDVNTISIRRAFRANFLSQNTIETAFETMQILAKTGQATSHICQQFLQAVNPYLSYKWDESQNYLVWLQQEGKTHLLEILLAMLEKGDFNTKTVVLVFARNLVQVTDKRQNMKQSFLNYYYRRFVSPCVNYFLCLQELQVLMEYLTKLYKIDVVRTRRALIQSSLIPSLEPLIGNKYALILVLKLIRTFLDSKDEGIFSYIERHNLFVQLRDKYFETKRYSPRGITYSIFLALLKDCTESKNSAGRRLIYNILIPTDKI